MAKLEAHKAGLSSHMHNVEDCCAQLMEQLKALKEKWCATCVENVKLYKKIFELRKALNPGEDMVSKERKGKEKKRKEKKRKEKKRKEKKRKPYACLCHAVAARHKPLLYSHKLRIELVYPSCRCGHPQMTFVSIVRSAITRLLSLDYHSCTTCLYHMTSRLQRMKSERHSCNPYKPDCYKSDCRHHECHVTTACEWAM